MSIADEESARSGSRVSAFDHPLGRRLLIAFALAIVLGWIGCSMALFGTAWDGRFDSEDHLVAHFLKWYALAYAIALALGATAMRTTAGLIWWARIAAWTAVGVVLSATLTAELPLANAASLFALSVVLAMPAFGGGLCLASVLKRVTVPDRER
jgi:hypothetical protein